MPKQMHHIFQHVPVVLDVRVSLSLSGHPLSVESLRQGFQISLSDRSDPVPSAGFNEGEQLVISTGLPTWTDSDWPSYINNGEEGNSQFNKSVQLDKFV